MNDPESSEHGPQATPIEPAVDQPQTDSQQIAASKEESFRVKVQLAAIVAGLSFLGSLGGVIVGSRFEEAKWRRETLFAGKKEILSKRMELLERTIRVLNHMQTLEPASAAAKFSSVEGEDLIRKGQSPQSALNAMAEFTSRAKDTQADLSVVLTLDVIYFGPQTKRAVAELEAALKHAEPWWNVPETRTQPLLNALAAELYLNLTDH